MIEHDNKGGVPATVTFVLLGIWAVVVLGSGSLIAWMVLTDIKMDSILLNMVSGLFGTTSTLVVAAVSYWVGATVGGKQAAERLGEASRVANEALGRIAETPTAQTTSPPPEAGAATIVAAADVDVEAKVTKPD